MTQKLLMIIGLASLTACSSAGETLSRLNPLNLFGNDETSATDEAADQEASRQTGIPEIDDGRTDMPRVVSARLDYTQSGVIVHAEGEPPTVGYHSARLRPLNFGLPDGNGTVWYEFRVMEPNSPQPAGTPRERTMSVGSFIPHSRLQNVEAVAIAAAQNEITIRVR